MSGPPPSDADLVKRARSGSDAAFAALVRRHEAAVRRFAVRILADASEADDLAQDAFVHAWSRLGALRDPSRFRSWVMGIAYSKAASRTRSLFRRMRRQRAWLDTRADTVAATGEARATALQLLGRLSVDQRAALALCDGAGFSHGEAAGILGQPLGTVKSNIARAKTRLRALAGDDDEQG
ncbi:MAG: RNA polymerase sigma factor [Pseudomonadota bacterium]